MALPTRDDIRMMYELNSNIKKLLKIHAANAEDKLVTYEEAQVILIRSRTWIQERLKDSVTGISDVNMYLFKGVDYVKYGNQILFKQASLERLKQAIINQS